MTPARPETDGTMNRDVWHLAGPIILSNVSVPLLGAVDTAVVGHLPGAHYIGGVAIGSLIFSFVYWGFGFLRMGTGGLTAQAFGAGNADEVRSVLARGALLAGALGLAVTVLQWPLGLLAFALLDASDDVERLADSYYYIRVWGAPAALLNYAMVGWFIGIRDAKSALVMQVAMNGVNIVLDLWFVIGLELGVDGVAWATLISEVGAIAIGGYLVRRNLVRIGGAWRRKAIFDGGRLAHLLAVNRDIFIRTLGLQLSFAAFTAIGARMGDAVLAANAVLMIFQSIMAYALDGFAHAAEALAGGYLGAGNRAKFHHAVKISSLWALGFAGFFTAFYGLFGGLMVDMMTNIAEIRVLARDYLPWTVVSPLISVWSFQLDGIFIGATRTADMRNAMLQAVVVYAGALAILVPAFGNHGLWASLMVLMVARALTLARRYPALERSVGG